MSNVWTSIAFKLPACASRRAPAQPLLQLFAGYARHRGVCSASKSANGVVRYSLANASPVKLHPRQITPKCQDGQRTFSTTALLALRTRPTRPAPQQRNDTTGSSGIEPAPTVASHTEGLPPEDGQLSWRDYDPEGGMPLPNGELSQPELNSIFGNEDVDADTGNYILSVMHWRRMSGALIDSGLDFPNRSGVSRDQALLGLQYVRTLVPGLDEQEAGQRWAEEESLRLQQEIQERSIKLGIYKREPEDVIEEVEESQQGTEYGRQRSGESQLQKHREEREAAWEKEQAELQAKKERDELAALHSQRGPLELAGGVQPTVALTTTNGGGITIGQAPTSGWLVTTERKPWVKYYEDQATIIKENILPQMSVLSRLGPSFLFLLATLASCVFLSENYTPPPKSARLFPDYPPAVATLGALTGALVLGFVASRIPFFWRAFSKYFLIVPAYPYTVGLLGSTFRHDTFYHLAANIVTLWLFGLVLHEDVGRGTFLAIFFASGAVGGFSSLAYNVLRKQWMSYIFGSSGAVLGVVAAACALRPNGSITVLGYEVPVAAWVFLALFAGGEAFAALRGVKTTIDHAGHLGGLGTGFAAAIWLRRKATKSREEETIMERVDEAVR